MTARHAKNLPQHMMPPTAQTWVGRLWLRVAWCAWRGHTRWLSICETCGKSMSEPHRDGHE